MYGAPKCVLSDNVTQSAAKFFDTLCALLRIPRYLTTTYYSQTNGQTERFNKTIVQRLRHYLEQNQLDQGDFLQSLTYAYYIQVHQFTETTLLDLLLTQQPSGLIVAGTAPQTEAVASEDARTSVQYRPATLFKLRDVASHAWVKLTAAQGLYKDDFNKKV